MGARTDPGLAKCCAGREPATNVRAPGRTQTCLAARASAGTGPAAYLPARGLQPARRPQPSGVLAGAL
eukprot:2388816-Alexandrium_andersonii.AAC.1